MITKIEASVKTGAVGTNGRVYLGICGREFLLDAKGDDFQKNHPSSFVLGADTNYQDAKAAVNNPAAPGLDEGNLGFPLYIRFDGTGSWALGPVTVRVFVNNNHNAAAFTFVNPLGNDVNGNEQFLSLGEDRGRYCFLRPQ